MSKLNNKTRINKFEKRRKNTKMMSILIVIGSVLLVVLLALWLFGGKDKDKNPAETNGNAPNNEDNIGEDNQLEITENDNDLTENNTNSTNDQVGELDDNNSEENIDSSDNEEEQDVETKEEEPSDGNVSKAYTGNWQPIGTEQTGPHTTNYDKGTTDRNEMEQAVRMATGLDDMITWWLANGGDQKVIATVSDPNENEIYRVYLSWIDDEGWQPTKIEELINNDKGKP